MAKRLKTRLSAGAAVVTGLSAFGVGLMATPAQAATVSLDYTCSFDVLNVGVTYDAAPVAVDLTIDVPASVEVGEEIDSAVTADVTIGNEQRNALYSLLGVRAVDGPDAATAAGEDGGLNTKKARNQADFTLTNGTESADGIMPLEVPVTAVPESGDLTVTATGAVEPVKAEVPGTYTIEAGDFQAYIRGYENADGSGYKTNITMDCTNVSESSTVATVEVTEASGEPSEPSDPSDPSDPGTSDPSTPVEANDWFTEPGSLPITEDGKHFTVDGTATQAGTVNVVLLDKDKQVLRTEAWEVSEGSNSKDFAFADGTNYVRLVSEDCVDEDGNDGTVAGGCNVEYVAPWVNPDDAGSGDGDDDGSSDDDGAGSGDDDGAAPETPGVVQTDGFTRVEQPADDNTAALLLGGTLLAGVGAASVVIVRRRQSAQH
ncbi:hypothetical protein M3B33_13265 [Janibacter hoylei]|uniref:DUF6801 domain-containing protein n=1 Tax=Janibacter hoylei TaxID=364298 RepID=UPI0021A36D5E|nr:DUF6801 domain-containing protein [Janibacter hoylei]MCT1620054.1 hypothetical protein [Janibacter hoylei]